MAYDHLGIEARWQRYWDEHGTFRATRRSGRPKRYVLDMFPYPSGVGLHVGHPEGYTATDIVARAWRMRGYDVLHPIGWDAFGLPAEQHAIETGQHPAGTTAHNIATFKRQLTMPGFSYDWSVTASTGITRRPSTRSSACSDSSSVTSAPEITSDDAVMRLTRPLPRGWLILSVLIATLGCASPAPPRENRAAETRPSPVESLGRSAPHFAVGGPNAQEYGSNEDYPVKAINRLRFFVGVFSHHDELLEGRTIRRAASPSRLLRAPTEPALRYEYQAETRSLDDYLARNPATGLLIARGDTILVERYQYARTDRHRFASFSMAKTVTAMLVGLAIAENLIRSVDDPAGSYVPALADTEYGRTSLRHLLQMSSGVRFRENYSGQDDVARLFAATVLQDGPGGVEAVKPYNERARWSGALFSYASVETQVLGLVLRSVVGRPVAEYFRDRIWEPIGAEADATWIIDASGQEATYCCLNAVLRDYARLGLLLAHDGRLGDRQIIPKEWLYEATTVAPNAWHLKRVWDRTGFGYGYQTWIFPGDRRMFALIGVHGQAIYVDPASRLVMVHTAVRERADDPNEETIALWRSVVDALGARPQ